MMIKLYVLQILVVWFTIGFVIVNNYEFCKHFVVRLFGIKDYHVPVIYNDNLSKRLCKQHRTVLYGVFSMVGHTEKRDVLRNQRRCKFNNNNHSTVFVVGRPSSLAEYEALTVESMLHQDIFVLSCKENMNEGKSFTFFKEALLEMPCYDFYAKVDDDTAFRPRRISDTLQTLPVDSKIFFGRSFKNTDKHGFNYLLKLSRFQFRDMSWISFYDYYNTGMLYVLSKPAVRSWVNLRPLELYGDEDTRTSYYMVQINATFINASTSFMDDDGKLCPSLDFIKGTDKQKLAVHPCKTESILKNAYRIICSND